MHKPSNVSDYMSVSLVTFTPDTPVLDAVSQLVAHRFSGAPVIDDLGNLVGMITEMDCLRVAVQSGYYGDQGGRVAEFMSTHVETVDADMSIVDLAQTFLHSSYRRYPVMQNDQIVGLISRHDVMRALQDLSRE